MTFVKNQNAYTDAIILTGKYFSVSLKQLFAELFFFSGEMVDEEMEVSISLFMIVLL